MKIGLVIGMAIALGLSGAAASTGRGAPPPADLVAKQAQAQTILSQIDALDVRFDRSVESWNHARLVLAASTKRLAANRLALGKARVANRVADERRAARLVQIYEQGRPSEIEVMFGSRGFGDALDEVDFVHSVMTVDKQVADRARVAKERLALASTRVRREQAHNRRTVERLDRSRRSIGTMLVQRRELLQSVQTQIAAIQAREAREQARRRAEAQARLERAQQEAAERQARLEREAAAARAKADARSQPAATPQAPTTTAAVTTEAAATTEAAPPPAPPADTTTTTVAPPDPVTTPDPPSAADVGVASAALGYLGVPYRWGGESPKTGFDCSGLVAYLYAQSGIQLPHSAAAQYAMGKPVSKSQLQAGDLVFFNGLSHVGIYIGNGQMVHAPHEGDVVKISPVFEAGEGYVGARRI